jgi:hypothetical protein
MWASPLSLRRLNNIIQAQVLIDKEEIELVSIYRNTLTETKQNPVHKEVAFG